MRTHLYNVGYDEPEQNECRMNKKPNTVEWKGLHLGRDIENWLGMAYYWARMRAAAASAITMMVVWMLPVGRSGWMLPSTTYFNL